MAPLSGSSVAKRFRGCPNERPGPLFSPSSTLSTLPITLAPPLPNSSLTLKKLITEWRAYVADGLKPSSRKSVEWHLRRHIVPLLGDYAVTELTTKPVQTFVNSLSAANLKRKTVENILLTLFSILNFARKWGYSSPKLSFSDLTLPQREVKSKVRCYSAEEMFQIVSAADEPLGTICFLLSVTGMRIGEVLALRVGDLDFEARKLLIYPMFHLWWQTPGTPNSGSQHRGSADAICA